MKAGKTIYRFIKKPVLLCSIAILFSCGTYNSGIADVENKLYTGNFKEASAGIDKSKFLKKDRNRLLYLLEKGKVEHLNGNYEKSNQLLEQAYILIDDRIKTNIGQAAAAKFTNPMAAPYKGEDFEKVTLHYYKALNYFHLGMPNEALVEAKRINIKLYELNEKYSNNKNKYTEDAFSQILQGILYETTGDINNAFIAYRNAEEIYAKNGGKYFGVSLPAQLKKDLIRTAAQLGFTDEYTKYRKLYGDGLPVDKTTKTDNTPKGEAIIFWENGLGPVKDQTIITLSVVSGLFVGTYYDGEENHEIALPVPPGENIGSINAIAIPRYRSRTTYYTNASLKVNNTEEPLELVQDFYPIAKQGLKDRMARELLDMALRFAAKKAAGAGLAAIGKDLLGDTGGDLVKLGADIGGAATEKADTRNWQTLPATISYARVTLNPGENKFTIAKHGPQGTDSDTITIAYRPGLQIINYADLGRTEIITQKQDTVISNNKL